MGTRDYMYITGLLAFLVAFGPIATHFIDEKQDTINLLVVDNALKQTQIDSLREKLQIARGYIVHDVIATMYEPLIHQTDSTPDILADGTRINIFSKKLRSLRFVALSRDMLKRWGGPYGFGDYIIVEGTIEFDGIWQVRDSMAPRWIRRIDFLMPIGSPKFRYDNVKLTRYDVAIVD